MSPYHKIKRGKTSGGENAYSRGLLSDLFSDKPDATLLLLIHLTAHGRVASQGEKEKGQYQHKKVEEKKKNVLLSSFGKRVQI